jgi:hypothetical protein
MSSTTTGSAAFCHIDRRKAEMAYTRGRMPIGRRGTGGLPQKRILIRRPGTPLKDLDDVFRVAAVRLDVRSQTPVAAGVKKTRKRGK